MVNTASVAVAHVPTPAGSSNTKVMRGSTVCRARRAGISIDFLDVAGSSCGALFRPGAVVDRWTGIEVTCIDNGMPVVILDAADFG